MPPPVVRSFPPLAAPDARVLILGSMPGAASLAAGQYYAHPRNAFWPIMGTLFGAGPDKPYAERALILAARGVAVWDVLQSCVRHGSLDSNISDEAPNDFAAFFRDHPQVTHVFLNGGKAASCFRRYAAGIYPAGVTAVALPSTSPAHAGMTLAAKCAAWARIVPVTAAAPAPLSGNRPSSG